MILKEITLRTSNLLKLVVLINFDINTIQINGV